MIERAKSGDMRAVETLYTNHVDVVYGYLTACGIRDADDLTSEVFVGVLRGLHSFEGGPGDFRSWLMTITYRRMVDHRRRQGSDPSMPTEPTELTSIAAAESDEPVIHLIDPRLIEAFAALTTAQREILALRFVADLGLNSVADITGKPVGAVKALQHRGLNTLRSALAQEGVTCEGMIR